MPAERTRRVLLIEDDAVFAQVLARALDARGFVSAIAASATEALAACRREPPNYAVLDLRLGRDNGLRLIPELKSIVPSLRLLLLTGYASIATAVEAVKRGADDYLAKPADVDAIVTALLGRAASNDARMPEPAEQPLKRLEWERIQRVLAECDGNVSVAARRLGMHRRTLQRKLAKRPVREG